jgi:hypothetical protein
MKAALRQRPGSAGGPLPPVSDEGGGGGGQGWALLTTARNHLVAHLIRGRLAEESIEVVLDLSNPAVGAWLKPFGDPLAPVRIFVRRADLDRASLVLLEVDHRAPDPDAPGSREARVAWWVVLGAVAVALVLEIAGLLTCGRFGVTGIVPSCT